MGVYIWNRLPSEYQEVEYIQSSGTQYINTGYEPNNNTEIECKINMASITNSWDSIYGATNTSSGASRRAFLLQISKNTNIVWATIYSNTGSYQIALQSLNAISTNTDYTIKQSNTNFYIDGVLQGTYSSSSYTVGYNMNIFSYNQGGTSTSGVSMKLYSMKIRDSGTLVRNFIPCYRKSDSVIGLYDLVNNQFYTNSGSGTFSKGSDVNTYRESSLKNAYIGEVYEYSYDFTKGSISDLTNQGWTGLSNCSINTTYGLTSSTSWDTPSLSQPKLTSVLSSAKKIKIAYTWYKGATGNTTQRGFGFRTNGTKNVWAYGDGSVIQLDLGGTQYINTTSSQSVGTYNFSLDIDLTTKKAVYSGITSGTYTITDSNVSMIRTGDELRLAVSSNSYIKNVSILVE